MTLQNGVPDLILDGAHMTDRAAAHDELARVLSLPDYYGRNLDALYDCCTTLSASVTLLRTADMLDALGPYGRRLLRTLQDAAAANEGFVFREE